MIKAYWALSKESNCPPLMQGFAAIILEIQRPSVRLPPSYRHRLQEGFANSSFQGISRDKNSKTNKEERYREASQLLCLLHFEEGEFIGSVK